MISKLGTLAFAAVVVAALATLVGLVGPARALSYKSDEVNGSTVLSHIPPDPKGVIYFFHGTGGRAQSFSRRISDIAGEAVARGYGVVFLTSAGQRWKPTPDPQQSPDIQTIREVRALLKSRGQLRNNTDEYAVGLSSGGGFASWAADVFDFDAVAIYSAKGYDRLFQRGEYDRPTIFFPGDQDHMIPLDRVEANAQTLKRRGVPVVLDVRRGDGHGITDNKVPSLFQFFNQYR